MENCLYPDPPAAIKRRAVIRAVLVPVLLFLFLGVIYQFFGAALTVAVPEKVTAVTLQQTGEVLHPLDVTLTAPEDVQVFCSYFPRVGKLPEAHLNDRSWVSGAPYVITFHTENGPDMTYTVHGTENGILKLEDSSWFLFPGYSQLAELIQSYQPAP